MNYVITYKECGQVKSMLMKNVMDDGEAIEKFADKFWMEGGEIEIVRVDRRY